MKYLLPKLLILSLLLVAYTARSQSPGLIIDPRNGNGITIVNPNGDRYTSATSAGFTTSDITQSEIQYKSVPPAITEPVGDQNGGATGGPTDFVTAANGTGFYAFYDGTNILFRFRTGGTSNGARGYSVLLDTDLKIGNSGFYADPNYVAPSASRSGNPGFEIEIVYEANKRIAVYNVDGSVNGTLIATYPINTHSQVSVALTKTSNNADYFTDFGVPVSTLGSPQYLRMVGTTVNSANSALGGNASDVFGVNDIPKKNLENNWKKTIDGQCGFPVSALSLNGAGICVCTPRPTVNSPISVGNNIAVTGMWNRLDPIKSSQAVITLFKNSMIVGTVTATTGVQWSITVPSIQSGDTLYAKAQAAPEFMCLQSDPVYAGCVTIPSMPTVSCASTKGVQGTIPLGSTVEIYHVTGTNASPVFTQLSGINYTVIGGSITYIYHGAAGQTANQCSNGAANLQPGTYYLITNTAGCLSLARIICIYGSSQNDWYTVAGNSITLTTPIYSTHTSVSGTGANSGDMLRLYINNLYSTSVTATGSAFTFNNLSLKTGDELIVAAQAAVAFSCLSSSIPYTVTCFTAPPTIFSSTYLTTDNAINGYSSHIGATVSLYRGVSPTGTLVGTTTVAANGTWIISGLTLLSGETYYAVQNAGCNSAASNSTAIEPPTVICPVITGSYHENSTLVSGTLPSSFTGTIRLYQDSVLIGTVNVTNATTWSIAVNQDLVTFTDKLSPDRILTITAQTPGSAEKTDCPSSATITCEMPVINSVTPNSVTITQGQTATFVVHSSQTKFLYSLVNATDSAFGTSAFGNGGNQNVQSQPFNTPGTYLLKVAANNLSGPSCRTTSDVTVIVNASILPVKFLNFSGKKMDNSAYLTWNVTNEINVSYYQVERSISCANFIPIGKVNYKSPPSGLNTYHFTDITFPGTACYRIVQVNTDGKITYSNVINITSVKKTGLQVTPNPAKDQATVFIHSETERIVTVEMQDMNSKRVLQKKVQLHPGNNALTLYDLNFGKGTYVIKVYDLQSFQHIRLILQ